MRTELVVAAALLGACVRGPISPGNPHPDGASRDSQPALRCDAHGQCNPSLSGAVCQGGRWQRPPCPQPGSCGNTHDATIGFCDPRWSGCVGPTSHYGSCQQYCLFIGKTCSTVCHTSRDYTGFGAEAWDRLEACADGSAHGLGQTHCDVSWDRSEPRWRCCCL
jgi:hypothetical protein